MKGRQEIRLTWVNIEPANAMLLTPTDAAALSPDWRLSRDDGGEDSEEGTERRELGHFAVPGLVEWDDVLGFHRGRKDVI